MFDYFLFFPFWSISSIIYFWLSILLLILHGMAWAINGVLVRGETSIWGTWPRTSPFRRNFSGGNFINLSPR